MLAIYDSKAGTLTYACAGHEPPILLSPSAYEPVTVYSSPPVGGPMSTGHRQTTVALPPGSSVCFFTDGLVEARLGEGMMGRERLADLIAELDPDEGAQFLLDKVAAAADPAPDDMAACLVRSHPDAVSGPAVRIEELELDSSDLADDRPMKFLIACGMDELSARAALAGARAKAVEFGGVVLRVLVDRAGATVEAVPRDGVALPVPLLADVRRRTLRIAT